MDKRNRFFHQLQGKQVWFAGLGVTNTDTVRLFAGKGLSVTVCDRRSREQIGEELCAGLERLGVSFRLGDGYLDGIMEADVFFRTPGMYYHLPQLQQYRKSGGILTSEMEVFFDLCPCPTYAVTGSDGKTTTTTLIAEMLKAQGKTVHLGGNIGKALLPRIFEINEDDRAVVELSSFQLISMRCAPHVAVVTNVTPNHLDVHGNMEEYTRTKRNLLAHQNAFSSTVLSADNDVTLSFAEDVRGQCLQFSLEKEVDNGAWFDNTDGYIYTKKYDKAAERLMPASDIRIPGMHNVANYLTAICAVRGEVEDAVIRQVAKEFGGVEHRIEFVRELDGVRWYNDSIATSPTRAIAGLRSFDRKIIQLAGGYDKKIPFEPLAPVIIDRVKVLILTGATANKIQQVVENHQNYTKCNPIIVQTENLEESVRVARQMAEAGDVVSLSPACASFDHYPNFEARGKHFKNLVNSL